MLCGDVSSIHKLVTNLDNNFCKKPNISISCLVKTFSGQLIVLEKLEDALEDQMQ